MEEHEFTTPRVPKTLSLATSTVQKPPKFSGSSVESSLGILSLDHIDISNIADFSQDSTNYDKKILATQKSLANQTLERASRASIPSKYLKPNINDTSFGTYAKIYNESTISESDLLKTPQNTSTPRPSSTDSRRESIFAKFKSALDSNKSTHEAFAEFKQSAKANNNKTQRESSIASDIFVPAELMASKMLNEECSWRRKYDLPAQDPEIASFGDFKSLSLSMGEFFQRGSDELSEFRASSPDSREPIAMFDSSPSIQQNKTENDGTGLSVSAIQRLLSDNDNTPRKVVDYLLNYNEKQKETVDSVPQDSTDIFSLPVSRDSSYTTSFSDNEAVRVAAVENKENFQPRIEKPTEIPKSPPPSRSSSSLTSLPDGKLPLDSTESELIWGCVKINRCVTKHFMLRNKSDKTLKLRCSLSTCEFKIRKEDRSDSDQASAIKFVLHAHESRPIIVSFIPTKIGSAIDELVFAPLDPNLKQTKKQCVRLWGYGGFCSLQYQNTIQDNTGKYWLSLGRMDHKTQLQQIFTIQNVGNLPSFSFLRVVPKHIGQPLANPIVEPNVFVLLPKASKIVTVTYTPTVDDYNHAQVGAAIIDIARLEIVSGPEPSRARLRRLTAKAKDRGLVIDELTQMLSEKITDEIFPSDVSFIKESPKAMGDLLKTFTRDEMILTLERDPNQTLVAECLDESIAYQTLCQETLVLNRTVVPQKLCNLEPTMLVLRLPQKLEDCLFLTSVCPKTLDFEVDCSPIGLEVRPTKGSIKPNETCEVSIKLLDSVCDARTDRFQVAIKVEGQIHEASVKVIRQNANHFLA